MSTVEAHEIKSGHYIIKIDGSGGDPIDTRTVERYVSGHCRHWFIRGLQLIAVEQNTPGLSECIHMLHTICDTLQYLSVINCNLGHLIMSYLLMTCSHLTVLEVSDESDMTVSCVSRYLSSYPDTLQALSLPKCMSIESYLEDTVWCARLLRLDGYVQEEVDQTRPTTKQHHITVQRFMAEWVVDATSFTSFGYGLLLE